MAEKRNYAVVYLRMSKQLRDGLQAAAAAADVSLNAFAVQVLAAAAGHHARFRGSAESGPTPDEAQHELRSLVRDHLGFPKTWNERTRHGSARRAWVDHLEREGCDFSAIMRLVRELDQYAPWHYVAWRHLDGPVLPEGRELGDLAPRSA